jgi:hypothetical protein
MRPPEKVRRQQEWLPPVEQARSSEQLSYLVLITYSNQIDRSRKLRFGSLGFTTKKTHLSTMKSFRNDRSRDTLAVASPAASLRGRRCNGCRVSAYVTLSPVSDTFQSCG